MVLLGGLELIAGAYLINEHKKHKKEKARVQEEEEERRNRPRPSRRRSYTPPRRKHHPEDRKHRSKSPARPSKTSSHSYPSSRPESSGAKPQSQPTLSATYLPASYYHPPPGYKGQHPPMMPGSFPPPTFHTPPPPLIQHHSLRPQSTPPSSSQEGRSNAPYDVPDGFSPEQRQQQTSYASNFGPIHYPGHLAELGDPSVVGDDDHGYSSEPIHYEDGLIYDERRNRHVRFALPGDDDPIPLDEVHPRVPPPPYSP